MNVQLLRLVLLFVATMGALIGIMGGYASMQDFRAAALQAGLYFSIPVLIFVLLTTGANVAPSPLFGRLVAAIGLWPTLHVLFTWVAEGHVTNSPFVWSYILSGLLWSVAWIVTRRENIFRFDR